MTRRSISVPVGILAALVLATNVSADPPAWTPAETVRSVNDIEFGDADFRGHDVAIVWDEPDSPRRLGIATSDNNGASFDLRALHLRSLTPAGRGSVAAHDRS